MSMSTHIVGFRPPDEKWSQMKAAWDACRAANVEPPDEVTSFFDDAHPGDNPGQEVDLGKAAEEWGDDYRSGYEVAVDKIPKGVTILRFYNSY